MEGRLSTIMVLRKRLLKASSSNSAPGSMAGEAKKKRVMYDGGWVKDKMEGHGFCKMASGATYSGFFFLFFLFFLFINILSHFFLQKECGPTATDMERECLITKG